MTGKIIIFSAPSGTGKTTIVKYLLEQNLNLAFSISATSRQPRPGEQDGKDYYFLTESEFREKIKNDEFLEWEEVYRGILYGTLKSEVQRVRRKGKNVILDVDVRGGMNIKKIYGNEALAIFIKPPSLNELEKRLQKRSTETRKKIKMRIDKARKEMEYADRFDVTIINDKLSEAQKEAINKVTVFMEENSKL